MTGLEGVHSPGRSPFMGQNCYKYGCNGGQYETFFCADSRLNRPNEETKHELWRLERIFRQTFVTASRLVRKAGKH
jgi:hypothetical protein